MIHFGRHALWMAVLPITLALATSGCASKKYVKNQVAPVNARVDQLKTQTNDQISYLNNQQKADMSQMSSQMSERIATTDQKISEVSTAAEQAQGSASRAMEESTANSAKIEETNASVSALGAGVANALNFQEVEKADVTFGYNKTELSPEAQMALDQVAAKAQSLPRSEIELVGFTDQSGSKAYNLVLSRRRAEAVQRYLVMKNVPLRNIKIIGLGAEAPPASLEADLKTIVANPTKAENARLARRVHIRVFGAGNISSGTASRTSESTSPTPESTSPTPESTSPTPEPDGGTPEPK